MTRLRHHRTTRRMFLKGAGGLTVGLPLLELGSGSALAQSTPVFPKRFIVFMHPQGMIMDAWRPTGSGTNFTLSEILTPLAPHQSNLVVLNGLDNAIRALNQLSNGHNSSARTLLTCMPFMANMNPDGSVKPRGEQVDNGNAAGPSIDQVIASRVGVTTQLRSLDLGIGGSRVGENQLFFAGPDDPVTLDGDPRNVWNRLFANYTPPSSGGGPTPPPPTPLERLQAKRGSVLDAVYASFQQVRGRVGATDRERLDAHAEKIREIESRLQTTPMPPPQQTSACAVPTLGQQPAGYDASFLYDHYNGPNMIDQLVMAMACDMTRVGTLQFTMYHRPTFPWLGEPIPGTWLNWHAMIHEARNTSSRPTMIRAMQWYTEMFAYLLQAMKNVPEGAGTMLDNSLVLWVSDFGEGAIHRTTDLPIVLAGGLAGALQTGRFLDFQGRTTGDLFTSILNMFGYPDTSFGLPGYSTGPLPGLA